MLSRTEYSHPYKRGEGRKLTHRTTHKKYRHPEIQVMEGGGGYEVEK
jgi:hypothetical protein